MGILMITPYFYRCWKSILSSWYC